MNTAKIIIVITVCCAVHLCVLAATRTNREPNQPDYAKPISPEKLKEDLDFLYKKLEEVHPNIYAYISKEEYVTIKHAFCEHIDHAMDATEFYLYAHLVVYCLRDSHSRIDQPPNFTMPRITDSMREFGKRLKTLVRDDKDSQTDDQHVLTPHKKEHTGPYSYHLFPEYNTCFVVINSFGRPDQVKHYAKKFQETFKVIRERGIANVVIDVRKNQGGCGFTATELLRYLANKPFRQIDRIEQRVGPEIHELCEQYGLDINSIMVDEYGIDLENLKSSGHYQHGMTLTGQEPFRKPHSPSVRFNGAVYLLIAEPTFSAASNFAAAVKYFKIGTLVGQETSGEKDHYGSIVRIRLPNSGLKGQVSTAHIITVGGMDDSGGVKPDYEVKQKPEDTAKDVDTALHFTLNLIKRD